MIRLNTAVLPYSVDPFDIFLRTLDDLAATKECGWVCRCLREERCDGVTPESD